MATSTRREFMMSSGSAALSAALASNMPTTAHAQSKEIPDFNIDNAFEGFMREIGGSPSDGGGKVTFTGKDPIVRSHFRIGASMAIPAMAAGVGAAAIWRERTNEGQDVSVDLRESIYNAMPAMAIVLNAKQRLGKIAMDDPIPGSFSWSPTINGRSVQAPLLFGNPLSFTIFETKDGRKVTPTGLYPRHFTGFLSIIGAAPNRDSIAERIRTWNSGELDEAVAEAGMVMGVHRTAEEWAAHPQGQYLAQKPVIEIVKIGDSEPYRWTPNPAQPLSGIRVLTNSHVIASTTSARTLAEYGAEVLHIARDQTIEHELIITDVNVGMRSSLLNLRDATHHKAQQDLISRADVFIEGFRGRAMERLGFGREEMAKQRPGIIYLSVRCYGWDGPWWNRAGFDMEALTVTGFTMSEGRGDPRFPPTMVLNDFIAGYIGAAGILAALRRRAREGGSYHVRISLARAAMWFASLGEFGNTEFDTNDPDHRMIEPRTITAKTPYGEITRLAPQAQLSRTPGRWREPLVAVRGGDLPVWQG
jgi:crotonobetainyl-CoA:carnitine CoA-transferase CaiB-like acyl-CoA transferase